jgi:hypothetical protein
MSLQLKLHMVTDQHHTWHILKLSVILYYHLLQRFEDFIIEMISGDFYVDTFLCQNSTA